MLAALIADITTKSPPTTAMDIRGIYQHRRDDDGLLVKEAQRAMSKASITSPRCTVCGHSERLTIDHVMACGAEAVATGRRFGLSKDAVGRHYRDHVSDAWKAAVKMGPYGSREALEKLCLEEGHSVVEGLRALYASHHAMLVSSRETGSVSNYLAVAREVRATLNDIGRITGELLPSVANVSITNTTNAVTYITDLGQELITEFRDAPEVLDRLQRVLKRRVTAALPSTEVIEGMARAG